MNLSVRHVSGTHKRKHAQTVSSICPSAILWRVGGGGMNMPKHETSWISEHLSLDLVEAAHYLDLYSTLFAL